MTTNRAILVAVVLVGVALGLTAVRLVVVPAGRWAADRRRARRPARPIPPMPAPTPAAPCWRTF